MLLNKMMNNETNKLLPDLRFPEFVNEGEWEEKTLDEVATILKGKGISKSDIVKDGSLPCIRYGELYTHYSETIRDIKSYTNLKADDLVLSQANDVIIPASGETQIDIATASCVLENGIALGGDLNIIRTKVDGVFLSYYLNNAKKKDIAQLAQGISVVHLYPNQLKTLVLNIPKSKEQKKIASCLSSLDEVITAHSQKLEALKDHKKGLMQNLFPQEGETVPKWRFPEFLEDGEWEEDIFSKYVKVIDGDRGINYPKAEEYSTDGYCLFLNAKNVTKDGFVFNETQYVSKEKDKSLRKGKLNRLDIVLTTRGSLGQFAYYDENIPFKNIRINSGMVILRVENEAIESQYLYNYCRSNIIQSTIKSQAFGNAVQQLTVALINNLPFQFPMNREEQLKIDNTLSSLDALITAQSEKIQQLKLHKKGLMQGLFPKAVG
jgi:type I restriction enzyme S subunit